MLWLVLGRLTKLLELLILAQCMQAGQDWDMATLVAGYNVFMLIARLHVELLAVLIQRAQAGQVRLAQLHQLRALRAAEAQHAQDVRPLGAQLVALNPSHVRQVLAHQRQHLRNHITSIYAILPKYIEWLTIPYIKDAACASVCLHGHHQLTKQVRTVMGCYEQQTSHF